MNWLNYLFVYVVPIDALSEHLCYNISNIAFCRPDHFCLSGRDGLVLVWSDTKIPTLLYMVISLNIKLLQMWHPPPPPKFKLL